MQTGKEQNKRTKEQNSCKGPALELDWRRGGVTAVQGIGRRGRGGGDFNDHLNDGGVDIASYCLR